MVTAIFRSITEFAALPEEKLKAVIRAGKIAEALCPQATQHDLAEEGPVAHFSATRRNNEPDFSRPS
jgi:hypothetical protein